MYVQQYSCSPEIIGEAWQITEEQAERCQSEACSHRV